jgi:glycosyltransferase involved in cell wall biosynthesis
MRILMLTHNFADLRSSFVRAFSLAAPLVEMGHEVTLIGSAMRPGLRCHKTVKRGVRILQLGGITYDRMRNGGLDPVDSLRRVRHALTADYDLIHGFEHRLAVSLPALCGRYGRHRPFISDWVDLWGLNGGIALERGLPTRLTLGVIDHLVESNLRRFADGVTVISKHLMALALANGVAHSSIRLVQVGANTDLIRPLDAAAMRLRYGLPEDAPVLVHIGFAPYDSALLAETFILLARANPRLRLLLAGTPMPILQEKVKQAGVHSQVHYAGVVPYEELEQVLACGDVMMLPLSNRTLNVARFPNKFGDYLAAGRPIATNQTGEVGEIVVKEGVGVAAPDHPQAYARAVAQLLDNPAQRAQMGARARQLAEDRLSWRALAKETEVLYHRVYDEFRKK